ncbi:MAG: hypothetical protein IK092_07065 [Muribaculaceae bacterium]|nr:hypothetical protein [Muribaculaceae bacterium]
MKDFNKIGKQLPYDESEEYLEQLINDSTQKAINNSKSKSKSKTVKWIAAAASIAIIVGLGITFSSKLIKSKKVTTMQVSSPLDDFLNQLSDDDAQLLVYYDINEIPEYE